MKMSDYTILLARQRSGTNPLRSVLRTHPEIACTEEVFNNRPNAEDWLEWDTNYFRFVDQRIGGSVLELLAQDDLAGTFLDYLEYLRCFFEKRHLILDVKYNSTHHLDGPWHFIMGEPALFQFIRKNGLRVLNLTRRNFLRYYVSEMKAQRSGTWDVFDAEIVGDRKWYIERYVGTRRDSDYLDSKIELDIEDMLGRLALCRAESEYVDRAFADYDRYLTFDYEELFPHSGSPPDAAVLQGIAQWLEVDDDFKETRPEYKKQSALGLADTIENYAEVEAALSGTEFEYCLADEQMYRVADPA